MKKIILSTIALSAILLAGCNQITTQTNNTGATVSGATADTNTPNAKLAICLKDKGATFYGTTRCSHCKHQKELFGDAATLLPFVDCDKEGAKCDAAGIKGYPTWVFADGTKSEGAQELTTLTDKTGCK